MSPQEHKEDFKPRDYQLELLEAARERNCIVSLGTGYGKTYIAILLIKEYASLIQESSLDPENKKRAFFVVNTVALALQQEEHIRCNLPMNVCMIRGMMAQKYWDDENEFRKVWRENEVFVVTAEIMVQLLNCGYVKMTEIALLIIDECHHIIGPAHPYRQIMKEYWSADANESRPRILGLTASVVSSDVPLQKIEDVIKTIERLTCCSLQTADDVAMLSKYGARPRELIFCYKDDEPVFENVKLLLKKALQHNFHCWDTPEFVDLKKIIREAFTRALDVLEQLGPYCCAVVCRLYYKQLGTDIDRQVWNVNRTRLIVYGRTVLNQCLLILNNMKKLPREESELHKYVTSRVFRLFEILHSCQNHHCVRYNHSLCSLIFVKERHTALLLSKLLKSISRLYFDKYGFLKPDFVVGRQGIALDNAQELIAANKRQESTIHRFRQNIINVLVSTSVLEEGIDVRSCNCVIRFTPPLNFRSYIQSRGRARAKTAIYAMLSTPDNASALEEKLKYYNQMEMLLKSYHSSNEEEEEQNFINIEDPYPPYVVESTGAKVTLSSAISLINRYCSRLPSDVFTRLVPQVNVIPVSIGNQTMYKAELFLPINAPIKRPIKLETLLPKASLAKMAVALEACKVLHVSHELTDNLLPAGKDIIFKNTSLPEDLLDDVYEEYNLKISGHHVKNKRLVNRNISKKITRLTDDVSNAYIYMIDIKLINPISEAENMKKRKIVDPHLEDFAFGFISTEELPPITPFPVFMRQGKTMISFARTPSKKTFTTEALAKIQNFHQHIFDDILKVVKNAVYFSPQDSICPLMVVPIKKVYDNDGKLIDCNLDEVILDHDLRQTVSGPTLEERQNWKFDPKNYEDGVVSPWYRPNEQPTYFYVARVVDSIHPASKFPDEKFIDFNHYYYNKYDIEILHQDQPLLEVDRSSERMNLIFPRHVNSKSRKQAFDPTQQQVLVPELVHVHPLSSSYWTMLITLPTIFYRLNEFLLVDELRETILTTALQSKSPEIMDFNWDKHALDYDHSCVQSIGQLKRKNLDVSADSNQLEDTETDRSEINFDIGVWDPKAAREFQNDRLDLDEDADTMDRINERVALGKQNLDMEGSDAEEVEEYDILTEFKEKAHTTRNRFDLKPDHSFSVPLHGWDSAGTLQENGNLSFIIDPLHRDAINMDQLNNDMNILMNNPQPSNSANQGEPDKQSELLNDEDIELNEDDTLKTVFEKSGENEKELDPLIKVINNDMVYKPTDISADKIVPEWVVNGQFKCIAPEINHPLRFEVNNEDKLPYGVPPSLLLQALTTASASDGVNLERLETIGDSFLKMAVTVFLFTEYADSHEGRLSFKRSKEVSNKSLCAKGYKKGIQRVMETSKFDPSVSWLPPCYQPVGMYQSNGWSNDNEEDKPEESTGWDVPDADQDFKEENGIQTINLRKMAYSSEDTIPYNPMTQQCISDKSVADAVEALIGAHLVSLGPRAALLLMKWLDLSVFVDPEPPVNPLLHFEDTEEDPTYAKRQVYQLYARNKFEKVEEMIGYTFANKAFLVQAFTHASYTNGRVTGCYQRLEFLGDAVLDYMITRYLYEHPDKFAPGVLTDLRSALVNNTIFASLAVKYEFHKYFLSVSYPLAQKIEQFAKSCEQNKDILDCPNFNDELFKVTEEEIEDGGEEEVEVPKALGDIFESLAGAIYLDCNRNLDVVWRVYYNMMRDLIEKCCQNPPQSPIRELFELKDAQARFSKLERIMETSKIRVTVEVKDNLQFHGMGRSFKIAKATAAKRALFYLNQLKNQK